MKYLLVLGAVSGLVSGCGLVDAFKAPEPWHLGVTVEGAPDAFCTAKVGTKVSEGPAPGNLSVPRWIPDPIPPKTKFEPPRFVPLVVTCAREGYLSAELTLREIPEGWVITGIKYWPGHVPSSSIARFQRSPTAVTVPIVKAR